jgi:hypothetical protein
LSVSEGLFFFVSLEHPPHTDCMPLFHGPKKDILVFYVSWSWRDLRSLIVLKSTMNSSLNTTLTARHLLLVLIRFSAKYLGIEKRLQLIFGN